MAELIYRHIYKVDVANDPLIRRDVGALLGLYDKAANRFGVELYDNGTALTLSGKTVTGYMIRPDGETVEISGTVSGNQAYVELKENCYLYDGAFTLSLKVDAQTVLICDGQIAVTRTGTTVSGNEVINTVSNASTLANKPPEYYLTPVNLLDNSDFRNPVNHNGQTSYTAAGETIDGWLLVSKGSPTCQLTDGTMVIATETASTRLRQKIANIKDGIYTFAANVGEKIATRVINIAGTTVTTINSGNAAYTGGYLECGTADGYIAMNVFVTAGNSITAYWAALYEGTYTAETLPPYVPKGYAVEALNCGVPVHPRNLLDNSDFTNPVNQRGVVTSGVFTYFIDRWITGSAGCTLSENGVKLVSNCWFHQRIAKETFDIYLSNGFTFCCETADGTVLTLNTVAGSGSEKIKGVNLYVANDYLDSGYYEFRIITDTSTTCTVKWAALYEGAYTAETLPPYVPKGYGAELAECMRYYQKYSVSNTMPLMNGVCLSETSARLSMIINPMRTRPTATFITPTTAMPYMTSNGTTVAQGTLSYYIAYTKDANIIEFIFSITGGTTNTPVYLVSNNGVYLELSADL